MYWTVDVKIYIQYSSSKLKLDLTHIYKILKITSAEQEYYAVHGDLKY